MNPRQTIREQAENCIRLAEELSALYRQEREFMVTFNTENLLKNNSDKEEKLAELTQAKRDWRGSLRAHYGSMDPESDLRGEELQEFQECKVRWLKAWDTLHRLSQASRDFQKHSIKNLDFLTDHLYRLLGIHPLYTNKGQRNDKKMQGKVVEGKY